MEQKWRTSTNANRRQYVHFGESIESGSKAAIFFTIGKPMRSAEILEYARKYSVRFIHAREDKILEARAKLAEKGVYCEHTTAANYEAYLNYCEKYGETKDCLITMCGAGLKSDH